MARIGETVREWEVDAPPIPHKIEENEPERQETAPVEVPVEVEVPV